MATIIGKGITFDDVLLVPQHSTIRSRKDVDVSSYLTKTIKLKLPFVPANMDTVTESKMAIAIARLGGFGFIHRFQSIEDEVSDVVRVKRAEQYIIEDPYTIAKSATLKEALQVMSDHNVTGLMVVSPTGLLEGIITERDTHFIENDSVRVDTLMTHKKNLITGSPRTTMQQARKILHDNRLEKLPLVDSKGYLKGLITSKDIYNIDRYPNATKDSKGRLMVGGSVGVGPDDIRRAKELVKAGADALIIDIAHGHMQVCLDMVTSLKKLFPRIPLVAGTVATAEGTRDIIKAGADSVKVGVGGGSTCITRIVAGSGVPQLTAIMDSVKAAKIFRIPVMADAGMRKPGDVVKAIAAGASTIMSGNIFAGCEETPGGTIVRNRQKFKVYRGMASLGASLGRNARRSLRSDEEKVLESIPEGVESLVPYRGSVDEVVSQFAGGLRSGMSYAGAKTVSEFHKKAQFIEISQAGWAESKPHDIKEM